MRDDAVDLNELVATASRKVIDINDTPVDADVAFLHLPNRVVEDQLRGVDVNIGLEAAIGAAVKQCGHIKVAVEVMLHGHAPGHVGTYEVVLAAGFDVEVNHALLGGIPRLGIQNNLVGRAVESHPQASALDDLVGPLHNQRGVNHQVKGSVALIQLTLDDGAVSKLERQVVHLVQRVVGSDDQIEPHVVGLAAMGIVGIVTEVLGESAREHMLDGGHNRLEIILSRHESADVVALYINDLVNAVVVGAQLHILEFQTLAVAVGKTEVIELDVT